PRVASHSSETGARLISARRHLPGTGSAIDGEAQVFGLSGRWNLQPAARMRGTFAPDLGHAMAGRVADRTHVDFPACALPGNFAGRRSTAACVTVSGERSSV